MDSNLNFKNRVVETVIKAAKLYEEYFVEYDYLLCSDAFKKKKYYIIKGERTNFKHLTGVVLDFGTSETFFDKCVKQTLSQSDFEIAKNQADKATKGNIRRKISVLEEAMKIFKYPTFVQEDFQRNRIKCSFAAENGFSTLGFIQTGLVARPKTLLKGDLLDKSLSSKLELVLRRKRGEKLFSECIVGDKKLCINTKKHFGVNG